MTLTHQKLVTAIADLPRDRPFTSFHDGIDDLIQVTDVILPEGPIYFKQFNPSGGDPLRHAHTYVLSLGIIAVIAHAVKPGIPISLHKIMNVDSIMASALEVLLAYTPEFSLCCPNYCDVAISTTIIKKDRRFLVWLPHQPHEAGVLYHAEASVTLARMECYDAIYEAIVLPAPKEDDEIIDDGLKRIHAQMQVALVEIAAGMGCKTYVAKNDQGIIVKNTPLAQHADVLTDLSQQNLISNFPDATKAGALIDCIWFKNGKHMPAVLEVEYTTGITSGLTRMLNFQDNSPSLVTRFIIAAPDEDRAKVIKEFEKIQFQKMKPVFLPFSAIHELYALAQRGRLKGVSPDIIDNFVERAAS